MAAQIEWIVDRFVGGEKALRLAGRFEPPHQALLLAPALMGELRTVVRFLVLAMLDTGHDRSLGGDVALEFIGFCRSISRRAQFSDPEIAQKRCGEATAMPRLCRSP